MATPEEIKAAEKAAADKAAADAAGASEAEVRAALEKGSIVRVQMPANVSSVNVAGAETKVDEDGVLMIHVKHALHVVEAFGGRILSEAKKTVTPPKK